MDTAAPGQRPDQTLRRWLAWFAVAVIVGMHAGTIFRPLGSLGETRVADWVDLLTPFAVLGCAVMVLRLAGSTQASQLCFFVGAVAFALGHGLHLAANSISNVQDETVAKASVVHLWDEVASHYIWYSGLYLVLVALAMVLAHLPARIDGASGVFATLVSITLVDTYIEGGVPWLGLCFLATGVIAGLRWKPGFGGWLTLWVGALGVVLLTIWGVYWYVADRVVFPEFSDVGWI